MRLLLITGIFFAGVGWAPGTDPGPVNPRNGCYTSN